MQRSRARRFQKQSAR
uniref:Umc2401 n=1 Tax=Arundo donax TaxID=35708 RepID=A0A0A9HZE3_ARUDO